MFKSWTPGPYDSFDYETIGPNSRYNLSLVKYSSSWRNQSLKKLQGTYRTKKMIQDSMTKFFVGKILVFILEQKKWIFRAFLGYLDPRYNHHYNMTIAPQIFN